MNNLKKTILCVIIFLVGLAIMMYPSISNYFKQKNHVGVIQDYLEKTEKMSQEQIDELKNAAKEYNERIAEVSIKQNAAASSATPDYWGILNINEDVMAYITVPVCGINLPIRHGCDEDVLQNSAGHIPGTSFPIGGPGTHSVITAHRGLPSAKLFTNIDNLKIGDQFYIHGPDETLAYEVDQIKVVLPEDTSDLRIEEGKDYVTLVTCTPYGINTHRLLVRGHRTAYIPKVEEEQIAETKKKNNRMLMLNITGFFVAILLMFIAYIVRKKYLKKKKQ
mgnify:CR=1 FL=1